VEAETGLGNQNDEPFLGNPEEDTFNESVERLEGRQNSTVLLYGGFLYKIDKRKNPKPNLVTHYLKCYYSFSKNLYKCS